MRERTARGESIYELDEEELREPEPDLIVTQALCMVCAVSVDDVRKIAEDMPEQPRVISLDPKTFGETLGDIRTVAQATDSRDAALDLIARSAAGSTASASRRATPRSGPRSPRSSGSTPSSPPGTGRRSSSRWPAARTCSASPASRPSSPAGSSSRASQPEVVVVMPCGYDVPRSYEEAVEHAGELRQVDAREIVAVDAKATFSRPGPRLVDGLELLAHTLHPELVEEPTHAEAGRPLTVELP